MNCELFSDLVSDIARDQMMDAAARTQALAHAGECLHCAARLKAQRQLTSDLRELVSATTDQTASTAVWESLSAAFDARGEAQVTTNRRRWIYAAGAIAAMLLLTFALLPVIRRHRQPANVEVSIPTSSTAVQAIQNDGDTKGDILVGVKQKPQVTSHRHSLARQTPAPHVDQPMEIARLYSVELRRPRCGSRRADGARGVAAIGDGQLWLAGKHGSCESASQSGCVAGRRWSRSRYSLCAVITKLERA